MKLPKIYWLKKGERLRENDGYRSLSGQIFTGDYPGKSHFGPIKLTKHVSGYFRIL